MVESIIIKKKPIIQFQFLDNGFELIDGQTEKNSGFYAYKDLHSIDLNNSWFPRLSGWLRVITCLLNGAPYFPDAESCKKANLIIHYKKTKLGIWLTDTYMTNNAVRLKRLLDEKIKNIN